MDEELAQNFDNLNLNEQVNIVYENHLRNEWKLQQNEVLQKYIDRQCTLYSRPTTNWFDNPLHIRHGQEQHEGKPAHITGVREAFRILIDDEGAGNIRGGPGTHKRFGSETKVIYIGFPDFHTDHRLYNSTYGTVSFFFTPATLWSLTNQDPKFHYRYTMEYYKVKDGERVGSRERSHLFLLSRNDQELPNVALRPYDPTNDANRESIWWRTEEKIYFRKKDDFEFIEFALLLDNIPINYVDRISFQNKKGNQLGSDKEDLTQHDSASLLLFALALHFFGWSSIPEETIKLFKDKIPIENLISVKEEIMNLFNITPINGIGFENFSKELVFTLEEDPVETVCKNLAIDVASLKSKCGYSILRKKIFYLRRIKSWILFNLEKEMNKILTEVIVKKKEKEEEEEDND